jgi:hypothetical protein
MPIYFNAWQVPANVPTDNVTQLWLRPSMSGVYLPLQYEHTVLRTKESDQLLIQFDVTGLPLQETNDARYPTLDAAPMRKLEGEDRNRVQPLVREQNNTRQIFIDDIQVFARKDRALPYRMKCGRLAMEQTALDPTEWDEHGRFGTLRGYRTLYLASLVISGSTMCSTAPSCFR